MEEEVQFWCSLDNVNRIIIELLITRLCLPVVYEHIHKGHLPFNHISANIYDLIFTSSKLTKTNVF